MTERTKIIKEYTNGDITVVWQPHKCTHSKKCWKGLLPVLDPRRKPWVDLNTAVSAQIVA